MRRLIFCPGICQIVNGAAALTQHYSLATEPAPWEDVLVLFGRRRKSEYGRTMQRVAETVWSWQEICWADHIILGHFPLRRFAPIAGDLLRTQLDGADEIWVSKLYVDSTRLVLYAFRDAEVVLYEDGAEEFIPQRMTCGRARWRSLRPLDWLGGVKREVSHWNGRPECMEMIGVCTRDLARVKIFYTFLAQYLDVPEHLRPVPLITVAGEVLRACYQRLADRLREDLCPQPKRTGSDRVALYLAQPFATRYLTVEDEYALYSRALNCLRERGYTVWWKNHPEGSRLVERLQEEFDEDFLYPLSVRRQLPVECIVADWQVDAVVSVSSTSLVYLHGLYGYPAYTAAGMLEHNRWLRNEEVELVKMFMRHVPLLEQLPDA